MPCAVDLAEDDCHGAPCGHSRDMDAALIDTLIGSDLARQSDDKRWFAAFGKSMTE